MTAATFVAPIDFAVFVLPRSADATTGLSTLLTLADQGVIDLLDLEVVVAGATGGGEHLDLGAAGLEGLEPFLGADSGLLHEDDIAEIASDLTAEELAVVVVYQDYSLAPVAKAFADQGGRLHLVGGLDLSDLDAELGV